MEDILGYKAWGVAAIFILVFIYEHIRPAVKNVSHPIKRIVKNLAFWPINIVLSVFIILPVSYVATTHALWVRTGLLSDGVGIVIDIIILDLFLYWWHRWIHETPFLWRFHEVHHLDEHLDSTSAVRFHFGEIVFATFVRALVIIVFAIPFTSVVLFEALVLAFTIFHHSNAALPPRLEHALSKIIITPSLHWVHHHALRKDTDSNYGTIFSFWDKCFGTKNRTERTLDMKIGVEKRKDKGFIELVLLPLFYK